MEQKPLILRMEEAKQELIQCMNEILRKHGLNCYLIEPAFSELYAQIRSSAQNELAQAKGQMDKEMRQITSHENNTK